MSHHFDTPTARDDPRLNLCDFYLFDGAPGATVMAMTVNPAATVDTAAPFRDEALYAFRFDTDGDGGGDKAGYLTGTDILNDGGVIASMKERARVADQNG